MTIHITIQKLAPHWHHHATGASNASLDEIQSRLPVRLPDDYRTLLAWSNGGTAVLPSMDAKKLEVALWPVETLMASNQGYEIQRHLGAKLFAFGDNGSDYHLLFDFRAGGFEPAVVAVPGGDLCHTSIRVLGNHFRDFLEKCLVGQIDDDTFCS